MAQFLEREKERENVLIASTGKVPFHLSFMARMGSSRAVLLLRANPPLLSFRKCAFSKAFQPCKRFYAAKCSLEAPDVPRLAETARISLTPEQVL